MQKVGITEVARKENPGSKVPSASAVSDQPLDLREVRFIDFAHLGRQFRAMKPFFGFNFLQAQKIKQSHPRLHRSARRAYRESRARATPSGSPKRFRWTYR